SLARHLRRWLGRVGCLGQRGPCKPAPLRRRLPLIDVRAFRFLSGILAPLGNSTNRRKNSPQISTTYFVPTGKRRGSVNALFTWLPPVPDQPVEICEQWFVPILFELQLSTQSSAVKFNRRRMPNVRFTPESGYSRLFTFQPSTHRSSTYLVGVCTEPL